LSEMERVLRSNRNEPGNSAVEGADRHASARRRRLIGWIILALYASFLAYRALWRIQAGDSTSVPLWDLQDARRLLEWMGGLALAGLCEFAYSVPLGFMAALAVRPGSGWLRRSPVSIPALAVSGAIAVSLHALKVSRSWHLAAIAPVVVPLLGCLFGTWMGTTWLRGRRARLWLLPKVALLVLVPALCASVILWLSFEETPLPFEPAAVTSAEKRQLVHLIRSKSPRSLNEGQTHILRLTEHDLNVLLAWGLSLGSSDRKAQIDLAHDAASLAVSVGVTAGSGKTRYLNLQVAGDVGIKGRNLYLHVNRCRLGSLNIPRWVVNPFCPVITSLLNHDRRAQPFLDAIRAVAIEPEWVEAIYGRVDLPPGFREDLFGPAGAGEEVLASTRAHVDHLLTVVGQSPRTPDFGMCFETAFTFARDRSTVNDPVAENRAAIFALGILMGHPRVEEFLGPVMDDFGGRAARGALRRVELRGRSDWTKHFCVSAAIALLSREVISDAAGLLKEKLDADIGGSGFSFADLLADRAGTTFAVRATRDEAAARALQDRLARGFRVDDFFPPAADLPEGIPDAELQSRYGGVGGTAYLRLIEEIERRIAACAAYR
jgi:hypothetical protein